VSKIKELKRSFLPPSK